MTTTKQQEKWEESQAFIDEVEFAAGVFCFKRDMKSMPMEEHWPYEIIGNIYENPTLLTNTEKP